MMVYRKKADRLIVRDVTKRLADMETPDWRRAVIASLADHPEWFGHYGHNLDGVQHLLEAAGVELVSAPTAFRLVGNELPAKPSQL